MAEIARRVGLGLARQSVQRVADLLVDKGWASYRDNPAHRRAKLLEPTPEGRRAVNRLTAAQHQWADAVGGEVGPRCDTPWTSCVGHRRLRERLTLRVILRSAHCRL